MKMLRHLGDFPILMICVMACTAVAISVYGIWLCFAANIALGVASLFLHPGPFIVGLTDLLGGPDIAQAIVDAFTRILN